MYKTHPTLTLLVTCSVMTAIGCSLDVTLDPEDLSKPVPEAGQPAPSTKKTVKLALGTCSIQGMSSEKANYSIAQTSGLALKILYPDVCELTTSSSAIKLFSQDSTATVVDCPIASQDSLPSPFYVRVQEKYWLPSVQNLVTGAMSWGSFFSQGGISFRTEQSGLLQLPGARSSGAAFANSVAMKMPLTAATSVSKLTAPAPVKLASVVFHVPSSCQIKGSAAIDLMSDAPEWQITSIEISDSPDFP